ncbi:MAG: hypothetical protein K2X31_02890, partial [Sphingopyxis sp.]|nr:hypothetical protein [Sphingopyxis sp.]
LVAKPEFLAKNAVAVRAFLADLVAATKFYISNPKEARQALITANFVRLPPATYFDMVDYYRTPDARVNVDSLQQMQDLQIKVGWQRKPVDLKRLVDMSYLPAQ